jgi:3-hydroxyacyl-CoA dehydrogenase/enoyl-CoA hydratase/3-hydroxybutyryl-CoA epimerase
MDGPARAGAAEGSSGPAERSADAGEAIRWSTDPDGIVVLTFDDPGHGANTTNAAFRGALGAVVDRLGRERDTITGVVLTSAKKTFVTGSDLRELVTLGPDDRRAAFQLASTFTDQLRRLETFGRPVVAALGGAALGSGLEIALACHHRIAADVPGSQLGLPEVTLGLSPSGGGIVRSVRLLGVRSALVNVLLHGQRYSPAQARALGLVDELVGSADELLPAARAWILANPRARARWDASDYEVPGGGPALAAALPSLPARLWRGPGGPHAPAGPAILAAAVEGAQVDLATASVIESRYFAELVTGPVATSMIQSFYFDLARIGAPGTAGERPAVRKVAVLGAGPTGASLAYTVAKAGVDVALVGATQEAATRSKANVQRLVADAVRRGSTRGQTGDALLARITATCEIWAIAGANVVIEVIEPAGAAGPVAAGPASSAAVDLGAARDAAPGALLCVVSAQPVADGPLLGPVVAQWGAAMATDLVGLRLSGPADRTSLVEVVAGEHTGEAALDRALDLVSVLRKTPIVVHESGAGPRPGSFVGELLAAFVAEAAAMVGEGVPAASVEQAGTQAGFPSPPLRLLDELSLPAVLGSAAAASPTGATARQATSAAAPGAAATAVGARMAELGRRRPLGRRRLLRLRGRAADAPVAEPARPLSDRREPG